MARTNAQEYAEKWGRRLKGATEDIRTGVQKVTQAPGIKAARAQDKMQANLNAAISDGTWAAQVSSVTVDEWKDSTIKKGLQRIAQGVDSASPSQVAMAEKLLAAVDAAVAKVGSLPSNTLEDNINRAATFMREMSARKLRRPGR